MSIRNLTWQQVIVSLALLAAVVVAYKLFGELPAGVLLVISGVVNLLLGRDPPRPPNGGNGSGTGNGLYLLGGSILVLVHASTGCAAPQTRPQDDVELRDLAATLSKCRGEGRDAGTYAAYESCKVRELGR